jgi:hypothetical protein
MDENCKSECILKNKYTSCSKWASGKYMNNQGKEWCTNTPKE